MPRIPDAELEGYLTYVERWQLEDCRKAVPPLVAALREAYQEIDAKATSYPYQYQPRLCPCCGGAIFAGDPHACTGVKP